ncbi:MAG TPA: uroporphyrinogen-III C-methyltransferase [Candidatus Binatia bacterium]|nr:uroporphyrinogen-III C-methyltransferase [Candidatus Binatia bacterium]
MTVGKVYLVGAGPGDPGLLTVRGLERLRSADVIVYDQLVNPAILAQASDRAARIYVGKQAGHHCAAQPDINRILIACARDGYEVVRLKGGDPFVFGRGGEEAVALANAGISFEIVPGVSSAVAVPAYAAIPLTHRGVASSFAVVTGHPAGNTKSSVEWAKLAGAVDTLVVLMGLKNLPHIVAELLAGGVSPRMPAAVIQQGTTTEQESVTGRLDNIVERTTHLKSPAVIVLGKVVELSEQLQWFFPESMLRESLTFHHEPLGNGLGVEA